MGIGKTVQESDERLLRLANSRHFADECVRLGAPARCTTPPLVPALSAAHVSRAFPAHGCSKSFALPP